MDFMLMALVFLGILIIINSSLIAYLYYSCEYKRVNKFFLAWVTVSTLALIGWFGVGLYLYLLNIS